MGAVLATVSVIVVYLAPRVTILLSKLPIPRVPTAGEPLDDIETQGGTTVEGVNAVGKQIIPTEEGLIERVRRANEYLTGILVAAALAAVVGCYLAVDVSNGFFWQGTAFAAAVATVLCLRGRSHHDLVQSATLIGSGLVIAIAVIVKTAVNLDDWQIRAVAGADRADGARRRLWAGRPAAGVLAGDAAPGRDPRVHRDRVDCSRCASGSSGSTRSSANSGSNACGGCTATLSGSAATPSCATSAASCDSSGPAGSNDSTGHGARCGSGQRPVGMP